MGRSIVTSWKVLIVVLMTDCLAKSWKNFLTAIMTKCCLFYRTMILNNLIYNILMHELYKKQQNYKEKFTTMYEIN